MPNQPHHLLSRPCERAGCEADGKSPLSYSSPSCPLPIAHGLLPFFLLSILLLTGCVERRIKITSSPSGARVWLNDQHIGTTPVETRFTFYGGYDVRVELPGYNAINELRQAKAPLYEYPGPDLIATALPYNFKPLIEWHFELTQVEEATDPDGARENLLDRAEKMRTQALSE